MMESNAWFIVQMFRSAGFRERNIVANAVECNTFKSPPGYMCVEFITESGESAVYDFENKKWVN